ncbi:MAG: hypothetical protein J6K12_04035, partial [Clostridia bacterium]|nr:hypothetical protein [Clostridia bacterium]
MKSNGKVIIFYIILIVGILIATSTLMSSDVQKPLDYSQVVDLFLQEQVDSYSITEENTLVMKTKDGKELTHNLRSLEIFENDLKKEILRQKQEGIITEFTYEAITTAPWWVGFLPYAVIIVIFIVLWVYIMNQAGGKGG